MENFIKESLKISVIIPCYNVEPYILNTLSSVFNNKGNATLEVIAIDDRSTDSTWEFLCKSDYPELICYRNNVNRGVSYSRNFGLSVASGDIVMFLDSDDIYDGNLFEEIIQGFELSERIDFISFGYSIIKDGERENISNAKYSKTKFNKNDFLSLFFKREIRQCMCSFAVRRDVIEKNSILFDEQTFAGEDQEVQIKCMLGSDTIYYLDDIFFIYKMQSGSFMKSCFSEKRITSMDVYRRFEKNLQIIQLPSNIKRSFNTYFSLEYFSVLKNACKSHQDELIKKVLTYSDILSQQKDFPRYNQAIKVYILSLWHRFSLQTLIAFFKKN